MPLCGQTTHPCNDNSRVLSPPVSTRDKARRTHSNAQRRADLFESPIDVTAFFAKRLITYSTAILLGFVVANFAFYLLITG